jgi:hypothetical protein
MSSSVAWHQLTKEKKNNLSFVLTSDKLGGKSGLMNSKFASENPYP